VSEAHATSAPAWWLAKVRLLVVLVAALVVVKVFGLPVDRAEIMVGCAVLAGVLSIGRPGRPALSAMGTWVGLGLLFYAYDLGRGAVGRLGTPVQYVVPARIDSAVFHGIPTVWLQDHLYRGATGIQWWEVPVSLLYVSHFFVPYVTAAVLWVRSPDKASRWVRRLVLLTAIALVLYAVLPTAPPWLAADRGVIDPVSRTVGDGFARLHLHAAGRWVAQGRELSNLTAAFPSLHAAYPMLLLVSLWSRSRWWTRTLLVTYVLGMGFALVVTGEHWVVDVVGGWLVALTAHLLVSAIERRRAQTVPDG
jgi:membrane-associated phospholipid phosphatase